MIKNIFLLTGTVIGAGIFSLPFVFQKTKILFHILLIIFTAITVYVSKIYVEVIKASKEKDQLPVYLKKFLGEKIARVSLFLFIFSLIGALTGYLTLIQFVIKNLVFFIIPIWFILLFKKNLTEEINDVLTLILILLLGILISKQLPNEFLTNLFSFPDSKEITLKNIATAYGVILFSLTGFSIIPELDFNKKINLSILLSYFIVLIIYSLFALTQSNVSSFIYKTTVIFAIITSYIPLSIALEETFEKDLNFKTSIAKVLTLTLPLIFTMFLHENFIKAFSITGGIFIALLQILIVFAGLKAKKRSLLEKIVLYFSIIILFLGAFAIVLENF